MREPHTENSGPPFLGLVCSRLNRKPTKGFIQSSEGGPPKTDFIPSHRSLRSHVGFSLFSLSISWGRKKSKWAAAPGEPSGGTGQASGDNREAPPDAHVPPHVRTRRRGQQRGLSWHQPRGPRAQPGCSHQRGGQPRQPQRQRGSQPSGPGTVFFPHTILLQILMKHLLWAFSSKTRRRPAPCSCQGAGPPRNGVCRLALPGSADSHVTGNARNPSCTQRGGRVQ